MRKDSALWQTHHERGANRSGMWGRTPEFSGIAPELHLREATADIPRPTWSATTPMTIATSIDSCH